MDKQSNEHRPLWRRRTDYDRLAPQADYGDGNAAGRAAALSFVLDAASTPRTDLRWTGGGSLQHLVLDYMEAAQRFANDPQKTAFIRGEVVGAFSLLDSYVGFASREAQLHDETEESLRVIAEKARLGVFGQAWRDRAKAEDSARARHAANVRWSRVRAAKAIEHAASSPA